MSKLMRILFLALTLVSTLAVAGCSSRPATPPVLQAESPAPDFSLKNLEGEDVSLQHLRGKPVMLNFWATWCGPCRQEMPLIQEVSQDEAWTRQGLVIMAINLGESLDKVKGFMEEGGFSFSVLLDADESVAPQYNIHGIPTTFFIDRNGIIKEWKVGAFSSKADIDWYLINTILEGKQEGSQ
jgi:peroxiredoxin